MTNVKIKIYSILLLIMTPLMVLLFTGCDWSENNNTNTESQVVTELKAELSETQNELREIKLSFVKITEQVNGLKIILEEEREKNILNEETIVSLQSTIDELYSQIRSLESLLKQKENEIERLNTVLESYETIAGETTVMTFYIKNDLFFTKVVKHNQEIGEIQVPTDTEEYRFLYWVLPDDSTHYSCEDVAKMIPTTDLRFVAVCEQNIKFYSITENEFENRNVKNAKFLTGGWYNDLEDTRQLFDIEANGILISKKAYYSSTFQDLLNSSSIWHVENLPTYKIYLVDNYKITEEENTVEENSIGTSSFSIMTGYTLSGNFDPNETDYSKIGEFGFDKITLTLTSGEKAEISFNQLDYSRDGTYYSILTYSKSTLFQNENNKELVGLDITFSIMSGYRPLIDIVVREESQSYKISTVEISGLFLKFDLSKILTLKNSIS